MRLLMGTNPISSSLLLQSLTVTNPINAPSPRGEMQFCDKFPKRALTRIDSFLFICYTIL